jgi:hypothetical protein
MILETHLQYARKQVGRDLQGSVDDNAVKPLLFHEEEVKTSVQSWTIRGRYLVEVILTDLRRSRWRVFLQTTKIRPGPGSEIFRVPGPLRWVIYVYASVCDADEPHVCLLDEAYDYMKTSHVQPGMMMMYCSYVS